MKRTLSLILVVASLLVLFASCGTDVNDTTTASTLEATTATVETTTQEETTVAETTTVLETTTEETTTEETTTEETTTEVVVPVEPIAKAPILHLDFEIDNIDGNTVKNVSGGGLDATITGNPAYVSGPTGGNAIHFGTTSTFDFLTIQNDPRLNFETWNEFTVDFWYKLDKKAMGWDNLFSKGTQNNGWYGVWLGTNDNTNQGVCWGGDTGNWRIGMLSSKETWHHITVVSKNGLLFMFLDGEQVNSTAAKRYVSDGNLYIGGRNSTSNDKDASAQFHGCIDDFKIYDYAIDIRISGIMGADADTFEYTAANGDKFSLPYRVYYPSDYDHKGDKLYPILFFLHGHGETGTDNSKQLQVLNMPNKLLDDIVAMDNCIILAPQTYCDRATNYSEWVASGTGRAYQHVWDGTNPVDKKPGMPIRTENLEDLTYTVGLQAASALLDKFLALDTVDKDRVYVSGISMGGCGTWELIARRPETFAAALPVCGSGILSSAESLKDIAIWAFHGDADPTVRPEGSIQMVEAIKAAGGNASLTTFKGIGHSVWDYAYNAKNAEGQTAAEWLLEQSKAN